MAKETKTLDVENEAEAFYIEIFQRFGWEVKSSQRVYNQDSRPVGAFSYSGSNYTTTYVQTETQTVDFTKLVFQRDTKMPNYDEIVALEEDFWKLSEVVAEGRPYIPPNAETMEDWGRHFEPELRTKEEKKAFHIKFGIAVGIEVLLFYFLGFSMIKFVFVVAGIATGIAWYLKNKSAKKEALDIALKPQESAYRTRLSEMYEETTAQIRRYDYCYSQMAEILKEADELLDI